MGTYERTKTEVPKWWLDIALPLLEKEETKFAEIARKASEFAGRQKAWTPSAITKFKQGVGRSVDLTNALSYVLEITPPFFIARTKPEALAFEGAARTVTAIQGAIDGHPQTVQRVSDAKERLESRVRNAQDQTAGVSSQDAQSHRRRGAVSRRARRTTGSR